MSQRILFILHCAVLSNPCHAGAHTLTITKLSGAL